MVGTGDLSRFVDWYLAGADRRESSPVYSDLQGLPPLLIHVGDEEILSVVADSDSGE